MEREPNKDYLTAELEDKIIDTVTSYVEQNVPRPFAAVMSGGFDSGLLTAITKPDRLYRVKFPYGTRFDETRYADAILDHLGMRDKMVEVEITAERFKENFEPAVLAMGEPTPHFSLVPLYVMFDTLRSLGEKNVLSGEGPDEYLGGYSRQIILDELWKLYEIPELRNYHGMIERYIGIAPSQIDFAVAYAEVVGYPKDKYERFLDENAGKYPLQGLIGKMDMTLGHIETMEQRLAEGSGVTFHYPYINEELAEYCYQLPDSMKIDDGVTKPAFRAIALKYLPDFMAKRAKMGGPVCPANRFMGWYEKEGDFGKGSYIQAQKDILGIK